MRQCLSFHVTKFAGFGVALLALTVVSPKQASAQFAVFDAGTYATMGKIWSQDITTYAKLAEEAQTATKILQNGMQLYGIAMQEASFLKNKQILQAAGFLAQHAQIPGHSDWDAAMTSVGGIAAAGAAFKTMTQPGLSMQYRIALIDSFGTSMLNTLGNCYAAAAKTDGAMSALETMAISMNPDANTRANQANVTNLGLSQSLRIQECQHNMQMQQAKLQMIQALAQREQDQRISDMRTADAATRAQIHVSDTAADIQNVVDR